MNSQARERLGEIAFPSIFHLAPKAVSVCVKSFPFLGSFLPGGFIAIAVGDGEKLMELPSGPQTTTNPHNKLQAIPQT